MCFLFIDALIVLPVLLRRQSRSVLKYPAEMRGRHKSRLFRDRCDAVPCFFNQILGRLDAHTVDIFHQAQIGGLF